MATSPQLQFWFEIIPMVPSDHVPQRFANGEWRPPRPKYSNIRDPSDTQPSWYKYSDGQTAQVRPPEPSSISHYKTSSFYFDSGNVWIYPCNAIRYQVGDGQQESLVGAAEGNGSSDDDDQRDIYDDPLNEHDALEDWNRLSFTWDIHNDEAGTSFATIRAEHSILETQRANQTWPNELLPIRYFAPPARHTTLPERGGLVAEIAIIIALIALSVTPNLVRNALLHCLQQTYNPHNQPRGLGWTPRRGLVVRVYREPDRHDDKQVPSIAAQRLAWFERGLNGFPIFFP